MISLNVLRTAFFVIFGIALLFLSYAIASAPTHVASRLGMRGLKRRRAVENGPGWARIEPIVRWAGVRIGGLLSRETATAIDTKIGLAGDYLGMTPGESVSLSMLSAAGGAVVGVLVGLLAGNSALYVLVCCALGGAWPYLEISGEAERRLKEIDHGLPYMIDLTALGMSAGLDFPGAILQVVQKSSNPDDPLIEELTRILQELQLGMTRRQVLTDFAKRAPVQSVTELVAALIQAEDRGNPVADVLQIQAGVSRMRRTVRAEESAAKASVQMVGPLFLLFGCIMLLIMGPILLELSNQNF